MAGQGGDWLSELPSVVAAAHELKAPLSLIRQLALSIDSGASSPEHLARVSDRIVLSSERALRLTSDLTRASRLQGALFELEPVNPIELCEEVASEMAPLFDAHNTEIRVRRNRRGSLVVANRDLLRRVLVNFSDNALQYAGADSAVELAVAMKGDMVRVGVRDYGPAVPSGLWKQLSGTIGKTAQPISSRPDSSGLGLYLASQFAACMQGRVGAIRHRDGTTFFVDLQASKQLSLL